MKNNIALDIMMGLLCIVLTMSIIGLFVIEDVIYMWKEMRE